MIHAIIMLLIVMVGLVRYIDSVAEVSESTPLEDQLLSGFEVVDKLNGSVPNALPGEIISFSDLIRTLIQPAPPFFEAKVTKFT